MKYIKHVQTMVLPILKNSMLFAAGWVICRDVCNSSFSTKKIATLTMYIKGFCM